MTPTDAQPTTRYSMSGVGYEYCNCAPGCSRNFSGFSSSSDGSCKAVAATMSREGRCGDVDLAGVTAVAILRGRHRLLRRYRGRRPGAGPIVAEPGDRRAARGPHHLPDGFTWTDGNCGVGSFNVSAEGVALDFTDTNWIHYGFDCSN